MYYSLNTQRFQNYFDDKDVTVRERPYTLAAQLLNTVAQAIDDSELRISRELRSRVLKDVPCGIDNRGVYYGARLPAGYVAPDSGDSLPLVEGIREGDTWGPIPLYDDRLPVPSRIVQDLDRQAIPLTDPVLLDTVGTGDAGNKFWDTQLFNPGVLPIPNFISFWVDGMRSGFGNLDIHIEGERFPRSPWVRDRIKSDETLTISNDGYVRSRLSWEQIDTITIRGLPVGTRLRAWAMPFNLPFFPDKTRPFIHSAYRDLELDRYWELSTVDWLLREDYFSGNLGGMEYIQSYAMPSPATALAVEPDTWGMFVGAGTSLYYVDRREPLPGGLTTSGIVKEPLYGLDVSLDVVKGTTRYVALRPVPYARAASTLLYRYWMVDPEGLAWVLLPNGGQAPYSGQAGWRRPDAVTGPPTLSIPVPLAGTYQFTMECQEQPSGDVTYDVSPYANLALSPLVTLDMSTQLPSIQGIIFDALQRMWIWTGQYAVPFKVHYDAYVFDRASRTVFLTDPYSNIRFS